MSKHIKLRERILRGTADANSDFADLCQLLLEYGFQERVSGSHHIFRREDVIERPNLQSDGSKAKAYQVRQIRQLILNHHLGEDDEAARDAKGENNE